MLSKVFLYMYIKTLHNDELLKVNRNELTHVLLNCLICLFNLCHFTITLMP